MGTEKRVNNCAVVCIQIALLLRIKMQNVLGSAQYGLVGDFE